MLGYLNHRERKSPGDVAIMGPGIQLVRLKAHRLLHLRHRRLRHDQRGLIDLRRHLLAAPRRDEARMATVVSRRCSAA